MEKENIEKKDKGMLSNILADRIEFLDSPIEAIFESEVKEWGNSAHVPCQKKFIGRKVRVFVSRDKVGEEKKE